jgi:DNA-binding transcriptional regulator YiaG
MSGPAAAKVRHEALCRATGLLTPAEIKAIREQFGWSQEHLADLTDFGVATISRWERGRLLQNRSNNKFLQAIRDCSPFREYLEGLLAPKTGNEGPGTAGDNGPNKAQMVGKRPPQPTFEQGEHWGQIRFLIPPDWTFCRYMQEDGQVRVIAWGGEYGMLAGEIGVAPSPAPGEPGHPQLAGGRWHEDAAGFRFYLGAGWPVTLDDYCQKHNLVLSVFEAQWLPLRPQLWDDEVTVLTTQCLITDADLDRQPTPERDDLGTIIRVQMPPCEPAVVPDSVLDANQGQARRLLELAEKQRANGEKLEALEPLADALEEAGYDDQVLFDLCHTQSVCAFWRLVGKPPWAKPDPVARELDLDMSEMVFDRVERKGRVLVLEPPLSLTPTLDAESLPLLEAEVPDLGLQACAATREALVDEIVEQLFFLWDEYALEDPKKLSPAAERLRGVLLARMRESRNAS